MFVVFVFFLKAPSKLGGRCNSFNLKNILEINHSVTRIRKLAIITSFLFFLRFYYFLKKYFHLFIYLVAPSLSCGKRAP